MRTTSQEHRGVSRRMLLGLICLGVVAGCAAELDTTRAPGQDQGFGAVVVELVCKRMAYLHDLADGDGRVDVSGDGYREVCRGQETVPGDAPADLRALMDRRGALVLALDEAAPEALLPGLQGFLSSERFLALYDGGTATAAIDALVALLRLSAGDGGGGDAERARGLHEALVRLDERQGYRPLDSAPGALGALARSPALADAGRALMAAIGPGGSAEDEWDALLAAAGASLRHAEAAAAPADPERTVNLALELLFTEHALLAPERPPGSGPMLEVVRRDHRGLARVRAGDDGQLPAPFADQDGDGLADVDSAGRFVDAGGARIEAPAPYRLAPGAAAAPWPHRDPAGRALSEDGARLYEHLALDATALAALAREAGGLLDPERGAALDALRGVVALMGPRVDATWAGDGGDALVYRGFDTGQSAFLDMVYGYLQILRDPAIDDVLALLDTLVRDREPVLARIAEAAALAARAGDAHPGARLEPGSPLWDDLMPVLQEIAARPGMLEDLLRALEQPEVARLGQHFLSFMKYKDRFHYDADQSLVGALATEVDRSAPDTGFNRSLWQRLLHIIADADGQVLCSKAGARVSALGVDLTFDAECDLFRVDDVAVMFVQSIAYAKDEDGEIITDADGTPLPKAELTFDSTLIDIVDTLFLDLDAFLQEASGIAGFTTHPTPQALGRMLFLEPTPVFLSDVIEPARCREGHLYQEVHADTLPVWEAGSFYDDIRPIIQVFADHDAEHLFVDLLSVLHQHWPSRQSGDHQQVDPTAPGFAWASDAVSYEPVIVDILGHEQALLTALVESAPVLDVIEVQGRTFVDIAAGAVRYLIQPRPGLARRDGSTETETGNGRPVPVLSPWYVLADAYARRDAALASSEDRQAWDRAGRHLVDALLRAEEAPGAGWRFRNPRARGLVLVLVDFLRRRLAAHDAAGDRDAWLARDLITRMEDALAGPPGTAILDLGAALARIAGARAHIEAMLAHALDEGADAAGFAMSLTAVADLAQAAAHDQAIVLPMAHFLGEAIRPERGWVAPLVALAHGATQSDDAGALARLLQNLLATHRRGRTPLGEIARSIGEVHRTRPYLDRGLPFASEDYPGILRGVADFLDEERRGLRKFIAIIKGRKQ